MSQNVTTKMLSGAKELPLVTQNDTGKVYKSLQESEEIKAETRSADPAPRRTLVTLLPNESRLVWLCDLTGVPYVRESVIETRGRVGKPGSRFWGGVIVGYSEIALEVEPVEDGEGYSTFHLRRVFWIAEWDRASEPQGVYAVAAPTEAVQVTEDALTVSKSGRERSLDASFRRLQAKAAEATRRRRARGMKRLQK